MPDTAAIATQRLVKRYGDTAAVDGIDLRVEPGEIYGFLGPNGAGKTTTVRVLITLLAPTEGDALIFGSSVRTDPAAVRLKIGVALQEAALDGQQTGMELLRLQGRLYGLPRTEIDRRLGQLRELVDIGDAIDEPIKTYSGGMKRRLDLAAALVHSPSVLFLDEPTTGLDPASRARVWQEVVSLNEQLGVTIFLTTQYLEEADRLAQRVGIIDRGRIVAEGTPADLKRQVGADLVVITTDGELDGVVDRLRALEGVDRVEVRGHELTLSTPRGAAVLGRVALTLEEAGIHAQELTLRTPTLDDVFLELTGNRIRSESQEVAA